MLSATTYAELKSGLITGSRSNHNS